NAVDNYMMLRGKQPRAAPAATKQLLPAKDHPVSPPSLSVSTLHQSWMAFQLELEKSQQLARDTHRYLASSRLFERTSLIECLEQKYSIELVEREMGSSVLIL
ncbi:hypothetical protein HDU91_002833, partial [Kappamyces sp. JEL0680]